MRIEQIMDFVTAKVDEYGRRQFCREVGISDTTIHYWKKKSRGLTVGNLILALDKLGYDLKIVKKRVKGHGQGSAGAGQHQTGLADGPQAIEEGQPVQL